MTVLALCHICGRPAADTCRQCGLVTCADHLDQERGICTKCSIGKMGTYKVNGRGRPPPDYYKQ